MAQIVLYVTNAGKKKHPAPPKSVLVCVCVCVCVSACVLESVSHYTVNL